MPDTAVLLYVGRLAREKNVEEIILYQEMIKKRNAVLMAVQEGTGNACREERPFEQHYFYRNGIF